MRGLFATLPDNRYKIFLVRTDNNSRRLVMDVFVRRGRVIDPSDESEGTRDRPPTAEGTQQKNAQQNNVPQNNAAANWRAAAAGCAAAEQSAAEARAG